jgi:hypothetical protein
MKAAERKSLTDAVYSIIDSLENLLDLLDHVAKEPKTKPKKAAPKKRA